MFFFEHLLFSHKRTKQICSKSDFEKRNHKAALRIVTKILTIQRGSKIILKNNNYFTIFFENKDTLGISKINISRADIMPC